MPCPSSQVTWLLKILKKISAVKFQPALTKTAFWIIQKEVAFLVLKHITRTGG